MYTDNNQYQIKISQVTPFDFPHSLYWIVILNKLRFLENLLNKKSNFFHQCLTREVSEEANDICDKPLGV